MQVKVGDIVLRRPVSFYTSKAELAEAENSRARECRVVYVHPLGRYHTCEFDVAGGKIRESFKGVER